MSIKFRYNLNTGLYMCPQCRGNLVFVSNKKQNYSLVECKECDYKKEGKYEEYGLI